MQEVLQVVLPGIVLIDALVSAAFLLGMDVLGKGLTGLVGDFREGVVSRFGTEKAQESEDPEPGPGRQTPTGREVRKI